MGCVLVCLSHVSLLLLFWFLTGRESYRYEKYIVSAEENSLARLRRWGFLCTAEIMAFPGGRLA